MAEGQSGKVSALLIQRLIAMPFFILGSWCVIAPHQVEALGLRPEFQDMSATSAILMQCFGLQALLSGLFAFFSRFSRWTFLAYAIALLPFFWFNYYFVFVVPMFNALMLVDFVSNSFMFLLCLWGWRVASKEAVVGGSEG